LKDRLFAWTSQFGQLFVSATVLVSLSLLLLFVVVRLREVTRTASALAQVQAEVRALQEQVRAQDEILSSWLIELEQYVYKDAKGAATTQPLAKPSQPTVQQWQVTRDAELRRRILALERWRMEQMK
jgi:hypothetical protein